MSGASCGTTIRQGLVSCLIRHATHLNSFGTTVTTNHTIGHAYLSLSLSLMQIAANIMPSYKYLLGRGTNSYPNRVLWIKSLVVHEQHISNMLSSYMYTHGMLYVKKKIHFTPPNIFTEHLTPSTNYWLVLTLQTIENGSPYQLGFEISVISGLTRKHKSPQNFHFLSNIYKFV